MNDLIRVGVSKKTIEQPEARAADGGGKARDEMSRILLVDDSPHAQRMGERILSEEGYEVVTVSNADSALIRLDDVDPDVVLADTVMPGRTGYEICQYLKMSPRHRHVRVILTAGVLENSRRGACPSAWRPMRTLKKPFEATRAAGGREAAGGSGDGRARRTQNRPRAPERPGAPKSAAAAPFVAVVDAEQVRAAVTVALDGAMEAMVDEITRRVLAALADRNPRSRLPRPAAEPPSRCRNRRCRSRRPSSRAYQWKRSAG